MATFKPIDRKKASEQVAEQIRSSILRGILRPGQRLPSERDLAAQFAVTRTTLREALKKLEGLKLIFIRHGDRATVLDYMRDGSLDLLNDLASRRDRLNVGLLENVMEARVIVGVEVARLAARRRTDDDLRVLDQSLERLERDAADAEAFRAAEFEFFHDLSTAAHNLVFVFLLNSIRRLSLGNRDYFEPLIGDPTDVLESHRAIVAAVRDGDPEAAARVARSFLESGMRRVIAAWDARGDREGRDEDRRSRDGERSAGE